MTGFAQRFIEEGRKEGRQEGVQRGEARVLTALVRLRFGELPDAIQKRIEAADADTLLIWSERVLTAQTPDEVLSQD
jgi:predicted transposase YdaD